ncbi:MAG: hypothetical protein J6R79_05200, partial [Bacteroidaceae bacterium]|nr:hypothetical protein [Bacteroidaceae bacterium]
NLKINFHCAHWQNIYIIFSCTRQFENKFSLRSLAKYFRGIFFLSTKKRSGLRFKELKRKRAKR